MSCTFCQEDDKKVEKLRDELGKLKRSNIMLGKQNAILWTANEVTQNENHNINTKMMYIVQSWEMIKKQQIEGKRLLYKAELRTDEHLSDIKVCFNCAEQNSKMKQERKKMAEKEKVLQSDLDLANKVILDQKEEIQALLKEKDMLYISIEKERKESESIKTKIEQTLNQTEMELEKTKKVLEGQQQDMNRIKQISKASFIKVRGSHTLDNVENYKKDIAKAQFVHQEISKKADLFSGDKTFEPIKARGVHAKNVEKSSNFSDDLQNNRRLSTTIANKEITPYSTSERSSSAESSISSIITVNERNNTLSQKSSKTFCKISANHVHISNVPTFNNYDKD